MRGPVAGRNGAPWRPALWRSRSPSSDVAAMAVISPAYQESPQPDLPSRAGTADRAAPLWRAALSDVQQQRPVEAGRHEGSGDERLGDHQDGLERGDGLDQVGVAGRETLMHLGHTEGGVQQDRAGVAEHGTQRHQGPDAAEATG